MFDSELMRFVHEYVFYPGKHILFYSMFKTFPLNKSDYPPPNEYEEDRLAETHYALKL